MATTLTRPETVGAPPERVRGTRRRTPPNLIAFVAALAWLAVVTVPLYYLLATTFRTRESYLDGHPLAFPGDPTLDNYREVLDGNFPTYFVNNVLVTVGTVAVVLVLCVPAAYAVVRGPAG